MGRCEIYAEGLQIGDYDSVTICFGDSGAEEPDCAGAKDEDCGVLGERGATVRVHCYAEGFDEGAEAGIEGLGESTGLVS